MSIDIRTAVYKAVKAGDDYTLRQLALMIHCAEEATVTVRGAASYFSVSKPAITRAADKLEERMVLVRAPDPDDRRSVLLRLTPQGRRYLRGFGINGRAATD